MPIYGSRSSRDAWQMAELAAERLGPESPLERLAHGVWWWLLGLGVIAVLVGVVVLVWPSQTVRVVGVLFGIYLLFSGLVEIIVAFAPGLHGMARFLRVLTGALSILLGLISFRGALESILLLALWIGFGWLIRGITRAVVAASEPYLPYRGWQIFGGVVLAIGGVVIIVSPVESVFALALLGGIWLIVIGACQIVEAFVVRKRGAEVLASVR
jgi:uncharacterized membrane protein HdeD (DUF308 family)